MRLLEERTSLEGEAKSRFCLDLFISRILGICVQLQDKVVGNKSMKLRAEVWTGDVNWQSLFDRKRVGTKEGPGTEALPPLEIRVSYSPVLFLANTPGHFLIRRDLQITFYSSLPAFTNLWLQLFFTKRGSMEELSEEIFEDIYVMINNKGSGNRGVGFKSCLMNILLKVKV